jgi:hypothetical protein
VKKYVGKLGTKSTDGYNKKYEVAVGTKKWHGIPIGSTIDDCTNFVSQALHAGGWAETPDWRYQKVTHQHVPLGRSGVAEVTRGGPSPAWENVQKFTKFAVDTGRAKIVPMSKAKKGDIIVMDWGGGKPGTPKFTGDHTMIVMGHGPDGNPLLAGHGTNRIDLPLFGKPGSKSVQGIEAKLGRRPSFICLHIIR